MNDLTNESTYQDTIKETTTKNTHFINDDNFKTLIAVSDDIYEETQVKPSIKKLVNLMIEKSDIDAISKQLIQQYS